MAEYLDAHHEQAVYELTSTFRARTEWPTWLLIVVVYASWFGSLALLHAHLVSLMAATPMLILSTAWYMSLQHELLHGHPTRCLRLNKLLGYAPLAVWFPYTLFRDSHLKHHCDADLTLPDVDPESYYVRANAWNAMPATMRRLLRFRKTLVGRMLVGPPMAIASTYSTEIRRLLDADLRHGPMWCTHGALLALMLHWLQEWAHVPAWYYVLVVTLPALSVGAIRSFYEHRFADTTKARIVINESSAPMRLLFLNNNYHLVHHDLPSLPWYLLPAVYGMRRAQYIEKCDGFVIQGGYWELMQRFALRPTDSPVYPLS